MKITKFNSNHNLNSAVAETVINQVKMKPTSVLGLATGRTFIPIYAELVERAKKQQLNFDKVTTFNLDEYLGIDFTNENSFHYYMNKYLFSELNFASDRHYFPQIPGTGFEKLINDFGGIDLQLLGLGINGHIGFNEPGSDFSSITRIVQLTEATKKQNAGSFQGETFPAEAVTMGLSTIARSKKCLLVVTGESKAQILFDCLQTVNELFPASLLQTHQNCELFVDHGAFSLLEKTGQGFFQGD